MVVDVAHELAPDEFSESKHWNSAHRLEPGGYSGQQTASSAAVVRREGEVGRIAIKEEDVEIVKPVVGLVVGLVVVVAALSQRIRRKCHQGYK